MANGPIRASPSSCPMVTRERGEQGSRAAFPRVPAGSWRTTLTDPLPRAGLPERRERRARRAAGPRERRQRRLRQADAARRPRGDDARGARAPLPRAEDHGAHARRARAHVALGRLRGGRDEPLGGRDGAARFTGRSVRLRCTSLRVDVRRLRDGGQDDARSDYLERRRDADAPTRNYREARSRRTARRSASR